KNKQIQTAPVLDGGSEFAHLYFLSSFSTGQKPAFAAPIPPAPTQSSLPASFVSTTRRKSSLIFTLLCVWPAELTMTKSLTTDHRWQWYFAASATVQVPSCRHTLCPCSEKQRFSAVDIAFVLRSVAQTHQVMRGQWGPVDTHPPGCKTAAPFWNAS